MANATADYGFVPLYNLAGEIRHMECSILASLNEAQYVGDPVMFAGSGDDGRPTIQICAAAATTLAGIIVGFKATGPDSLATQYSAASTAATAIVVPALPFTVFRVNSSTTISQDEIGLLWNHQAGGGGDTLTGRSSFSLDVDGTPAGATTLNTWRLIGFDRRPDNEFSATVSTATDDTDCLVVPVETIWNYGVAGTSGEGV